jgi:hypothetical protein
MYKDKIFFWMNLLIFLDLFIFIVSGFLTTYLLNKGIWLYTNLIFTKEVWTDIFYVSIIILIILYIIRISMGYLETLIKIKDQVKPWKKKKNAYSARL